MNATIKKIKNKGTVAKTHIDPKLFKRLMIFATIIFVVMSSVSYKIFLGQISFSLSSVGFLAGLTIGVISGRMFKISWHAETEKVVSRLDRIGAIFLVFYIAVEVGRKWMFGHWFHGAQLNAFGLIFLAGLLLGRFAVMANNIKKVLLQEKKIYSRHF